MTDIYKQEFMSYINTLFYTTQTHENYNSFIIDFTDKETKQYFINGCISWVKLIYGVDITKQQVINLYIKFSQYNKFTFEEKSDKILDKFIITKEVMEECMNSKILPLIKYKLENSTVKEMNLEQYIKKKK